MKRYTCFLTVFLLTQLLYSQQVRVLNREKSAIDFKGLSVVDDFVFWVSGTNGTIGMTYNGGKSFNWVSPKGYSDREFVAIHALDYKTAIAVAAGSPPLILRTIDLGASWQEVFFDVESTAKLTDINFTSYSKKWGIVVGNDNSNKPYILKTEDGGFTWEKMEEADLPDFDSGESFFATGGANVKMIDDRNYMAVSGGSNSTFMVNTVPPINVDIPNTKIHGFDYMHAENFGLIVGENPSNTQAGNSNLVIFSLKDNFHPEIEKPTTPPSGNISSVVIKSQYKAVTCGKDGVDISIDKGQNWVNISDISFNSCTLGKTGNRIFFVGSEGKIAMLQD